MILTDPILGAVLDEMDRAEEAHGPMPTDIVRAGAIVAEECGELVKAINDYTHHNEDLTDCRTEALHTAATALRFVEALDAGRVW